ncbi:hypothetical protein LAN17_20720, partial [Mycobacterium tuberculosis]|nr:hypothetical protein [Mycobacterium tuberculosis]
MGFLRFCRPASVPVCLPGGAALTGATGPEYGGLRRYRHTAVKAELGLRTEDQRRFRLAELAQRMGKAAYLIDDASAIQEAWVKDAAGVGGTAGASAPDILVP